MKLVFKPKGKAKTVEIEVKKLQFCGGKYTILLNNEGHNAYEFAVSCEGIVEGLFITIPSQFELFTKESLANLIRKQYFQDTSYPTWSEVYDFVDEVFESIQTL